MGSSSSAEERQNAVSESYSYSNVQTSEEAQRLSPHSPKGKSRDATPVSPLAAEVTGSIASRHEERALIQKATPAAFTKVKLWQLVLFGTLLFLMFVCTIMVLISYCGGYLGYAPLTARSPESPKVRHPWKMENVALDCSTDRWRDTEEWSDIKLDYCCENTGVGCERVPGYSCDALNEAPIFIEKRWCCTQESMFCEQLDHDLQVASKQGLPECEDPFFQRPESRLLGQRLRAVASCVAEELTPKPENMQKITMVHGDFKGANYFLKNEGEGCCAFDFQWTGPGIGATDLIYLFCGSVEDEIVEDYQTWLKVYHSHLNMDQYSLDEFLLDFKLATLDYARWVFAYRLAGDSPEKFRKRAKNVDVNLGIFRRHVPRIIWLLRLVEDFLPDVEAMCS